MSLLFYWKTKKLTKREKSKDQNCSLSCFSDFWLTIQQPISYKTCINSGTTTSYIRYFSKILKSTQIGINLLYSFLHSISNDHRTLLLSLGAEKKGSLIPLNLKLQNQTWLYPKKNMAGYLTFIKNNLRDQVWHSSYLPDLHSLNNNHRTLLTPQCSFEINE